MGLFDQVKLKAPSVNKFDLSHERKFSLDMGYLYPILTEEILPGDSFRVKTEVMMRFAPMLAPVMHRINCRIDYFFIPNRLVWDEWEDFITGGREGLSNPTPPTLPVSDETREFFLKNRLPDYYGVKPLVDSLVNQPYGLNAMPFRAYNLVWNEYFRDQNVSAGLTIPKTGGTVLDTEMAQLTSLAKSAWEKDYFTSALPWTQRGPEAGIPFDIQYMDNSEVYSSATNLPFPNPGAVLAGGADPLNEARLTGDTGSGVEGARIENLDAAAINVTINELRRTNALQVWLENNARGGGRYIEQLKAHFNVISDDARLQRPEYLGGGKTPCVISEVLSTFQQETEALPQGNMAGHGISVGTNNGFSRRFKEHGTLLGLLRVLPRTAYQDGIPRWLRRFDKFDYAFPEFANIGEQAIKNGELYYSQTAAPATIDGTFGYTPRYSEYKYGCSTVHGDFRDQLDYWHMGRKFATAPALNESFITADPTKRIFAVDDPSTQSLYCQLYNKVDALRKLPYFGVPNL